jgi:hypothetical protein
MTLRDGGRENLIYICDGVERIPEGPGVYLFGRMFGDALTPLYVGKALNLHSRICQQFNNARLMKGLENATNGRRVLAVGELVQKQGQQANKAVTLSERALIEYLLAEGCELLNVQGTRTPVHSLRFRGNRVVRSVLPMDFTMRRST